MFRFFSVYGFSSLWFLALLVFKGFSVYLGIRFLVFRVFRVLGFLGLLARSTSHAEVPYFVREKSLRPREVWPPRELPDVAPLFQPYLLARASEKYNLKFFGKLRQRATTLI